MIDKNNNYNAKDIVVLEGLEPVRKRPGMYVGGTDNNALHHLVHEIIDNSVDEIIAGFAKKVEIKMHADGFISIADNGRGIPIDNHPKFPDKSALEIILTTLHSLVNLVMMSIKLLVVCMVLVYLLLMLYHLN